MGADDERKTGFFGLPMGPHHARQRAFVGDRQRKIPQLHGARNQFLGMGRTVQEGKIGQEK